MILRHHFNTIDSTHNYAIQHVNELKEEQWLLYTADEQTAGRGQYSRKWISPVGVNIYATFVLPFPLEKQHLLSNAAQVVALAIANTLEGKGFSPKIKWANDLLLGDKKIGGTLCENIQLLEDCSYSALIVSFGLNVNMSKEICETIDQPVTSLQIETGKEWDREELLQILQLQIYQYIELLKNSGFAVFLKELNNHLAFINEPVHIQLPEKIIPGIFEGINNQGFLRLRLSSGEIQEFSTGRLNPTGHL